MANQALFAAVYGFAGTGKTLANIRAAPRGIMLGPRGAAACGSFIGWQPQPKDAPRQYVFVEVYTIKDVFNWFETHEEKLYRVPFIAVSDVSILADNEIARIKRPKKDGGEGKANWDVQTAFIDAMRELRDFCRTRCPCPIVWEFHVTNPRNTKDQRGNDKFIPGGLQVPGWNVPERLPGIFDAVLRVVHDPTINPLWPYAYSVEPDPEFVTKDRFNVFPARSPLNLREALASEGYSFGMPDELMWLNDAIEHTAETVLKLDRTDTNYKENLRETLKESAEFAGAAQAQGGGSALDPRTASYRVRWALYDGMDRAFFRSKAANAVDDFINTITL